MFYNIFWYSESLPYIIGSIPELDEAIRPVAIDNKGIIVYARIKRVEPCDLSDEEKADLSFLKRLRLFNLKWLFTFLVTPTPIEDLRSSFLTVFSAFW